MYLPFSLGALTARTAWHFLPQLRALLTPLPALPDQITPESLLGLQGLLPLSTALEGSVYLRESSHSYLL